MHASDTEEHLSKFEKDFVPVLLGAFDMFAVEGDGVKDETGGGLRSDVDRIYAAEHRVKETRRQCVKIADSAREDLRSESVVVVAGRKLATLTYRCSQTSRGSTTFRRPRRHGLQPSHQRRSTRRA